jgi:hypothetical protein
LSLTLRGGRYGIVKSSLDELQKDLAKAEEENRILRRRGGRGPVSTSSTGGAGAGAAGEGGVGGTGMTEEELAEHEEEKLLMASHLARSAPACSGAPDAARRTPSGAG